MNNILSSAMRPRSFHHTCRNLSGAIPIPTALQDNIHQRMANRRRFYKNVGVEALPGDPGRPAIYKVTLDGRTLRTPARKDLHLPNIELAIAIALEWDAQTNPKTGIQPATMPMMMLASTAIDTIENDPETVINTCLGYLPTDSALFWTTEDDRILLKKQKQTYDPLIRWAKKEIGLDLQTTKKMTGKLNIPDETKAYARSIAEKMDHFELACLQCAVMTMVHLIPVSFRKLNLQDACAASRVEEDFQTEIWGIVEGGHDMDILNNRISLSSVDTFLTSYWGDKEIGKSLSSRIGYLTASSVRK